MHDKRKNPRYQTMGQARIDGVIKGDVYLKDISVTGCCLECACGIDKIPIKIDEKYTINIKPEKAAHIGSFDIEAECKWLYEGESSCDLGFFIILSPGDKYFQRYVEIGRAHV